VRALAINANVPTGICSGFTGRITPSIRFIFADALPKLTNHPPWHKMSQ
jgi:hypothetical protein